MHKKRADVLRHFKKDAANLAIAWGQYQSEQHHRYPNAALRMHNGLKIQAEEQQQLLTHARAITEALPEEMSAIPLRGDFVIAVGQSEQWQKWDKSPPALPAKVLAFPDREAVTSDAARSSHAPKPSSERDKSERVPVCSSRFGGVSSSANQDVRDQELRASDLSASFTAGETAKGAFAFSSSTSSVPINEEGNALNPDAYKLWKPQHVEGEPLAPGQFRERLAALTQKLSMPKPKKEARG